MIFDMIATKLNGGYSGYYGSIFETEEDDFVHNLPQTITQLVKKDQEKIILLESIDLGLLPTSTRLLSSILARLEACVIGHRSRRMELFGAYQDALMQLQQLQCSVVIGLEGNLDERKGLLDPDAYAVEVMRAARATIGITKRFHETLAALTKEYFNGVSLFIQGIILPAQYIIPSSLKLFDSSHMLFVIEKSS
ncbi:MAG: hypothetical protein AAB975_02810 [Patescibacteria group bacterium]